MRRTLLNLLLTLAAVLGAGPAHAWFHHVELVAFDGVQLHGEHCDHFGSADDHHADCGLCASSRVSKSTPSAAVASVGTTRPLPTHAPDDPRMVSVWAQRILGARAPPTTV